MTKFTTRLGSPIQTAADVAELLNVEEQFLTHSLFVAPRGQRYRTFTIPKSSGGVRTITAPNYAISHLQVALKSAIDPFVVPGVVSHGFVNGRSIASNASAHCHRRWVFNLDLANFFGSISYSQIKSMFMKPPFAVGEPAAAIIADIATHRNGLPQGACTSPALSNLIASDLDKMLLALAQQLDLRVTRYADDITFSSDDERFPGAIGGFLRSKHRCASAVVAIEFEKRLAEYGFRVNHQKTRLQGRGGRQEVTGLTVNEFPNPTRFQIRRVRAMLHSWSVHGLKNAAHEHVYVHRRILSKKPSFVSGEFFRQVVKGHVAFLQMVRGRTDPLCVRFADQIARLETRDVNPDHEMAGGD